MQRLLPDKSALIVAGFDPSGGAGVVLDARVFSAFGVHAAALITANTVQNSCGAKGAFPVQPDLFGRQLEALLEDFSFGVVKVGMLGRSSFLTEVLNALDAPAVVDPVLASKNGKPLVDDPSVYLREASRIFLITPNLPEARRLAELDTDDPKRLLKALREIGFKNVLLKGGHFKGEIADYLLTEGGELYRFPRKRIKKEPRGTGCALSSAIAALLLKKVPLPRAVDGAGRFVNRAVENAKKLGACHELLAI